MSCTPVAAVIAGWIYLVAQAVSGAIKSAFFARPAAGEPPVPFGQPGGLAPQVSPPTRQANYRLFGVGWRRTANWQVLQAAERRARGARAPGEGETVPPSSLFGIGCGFTFVLVVIVVVIALYLHNLGPWSSVSSPTSNDLLSVAMVSPTDGWAVGDGGTILHYSAGSWSTVSSPTKLILFSVAMTSPTEGWAVGERGTMLRYHGGSWSSAGSLTSYILHGVAMVSPTDGWAVGEAGTILQYRDASWSKVSSPIKLLFSVAMISPTESWVVGGGGTILHYSGVQ